MLKAVTLFTTAQVPVLDLEVLAQEKFVPLGPQDVSRGGWAPVLSNEDALALVAAPWVQLVYRHDSKSVPGSVLREAVAARVAELEDSTGVPVSRAQKADIKLAVQQQLLAQAFVKTGKVPVLLNTKTGEVFIGTTSRGALDTLGTLWSRTFPGCTLANPAWVNAPATAMHQWLSAQAAPEQFTLDDHCVLENGTGARVTLKKHALFPEVTHHLEEGKIPVSLGLTYTDQVSFKLTDMGQLKGLDYSITAERDDVDPHTAAVADVMLNANLLSEVFNRLTEAFGGLQATPA